MFEELESKASPKAARLNRRQFMMSTLGVGLAAGGAPAWARTRGRHRARAGGSLDGQTKLRFAIWDPIQQPAMQKLIDMFEASHPNVKISLELTPWDSFWTKLQTEATGGTMPDLMWMGFSEYEDYARAGLLLPQSHFIKKDGVNLADWPHQSIKGFTLNGHIWGLPKDFDNIGLWYNKKLFDQAGIKYPDETWDWATLRQVSKRLTGDKVWGIAAQNWEGNFTPTIYQNNGYLWNGKQSGFGTTADIEAVKYWPDFIFKDHSSPTSAEMTATDADTLFMSSKIAMLYEGCWETAAFAQSQVKDIIDTAVLPMGKKRGNETNSLAVSIAKSTKSPQMAWEFAKMVGGAEGAQVQGRGGAVIPAYKGGAELFMKAYPKYNMKVYLDQMAYAKVTTIRAHSTAISNAETKYLTPVWSGQQSAGSACKQLARKMDQIMAGKNP
ncbi:MAG: sugar ABC transporter substrate-binding protein [Acidimicrobiaceae bacterium]|nr:sugar ABC transporter substrate-binding protein [Acidimicrobiaceae bacterium]